MHTRLLLAVLVAALASAAPARAQERGYVVIVNAANPVTSLSRSDVAKLFLRKLERWPTGAPVVPVDLAEDSPVRARFTRDVLGRPVTALQAYWQQQIFSGRGIPPTVKASESDVIAYVRANVNAVGYVSPQEAQAAGTHVVSLEE